MEIVLSLPEKQFIGSTPEQTAAKIKLYAALGLYQAGEISIGAACELAELDRYSFLSIMKREGISIKTASESQIESDLNNLLNTM